MICKKCGCRVSDTAVFCDKCGASMAEFGQKEVSETQKTKSPKERKKRMIIVALIILGILVVLFGVKKVAVANKAVEAIRDEYVVVSGVKEVYVEHYTFGLDKLPLNYEKKRVRNYDNCCDFPATKKVRILLPKEKI